MSQKKVFCSRMYLHSVPRRVRRDLASMFHAEFAEIFLIFLNAKCHLIIYYYFTNLAILINPSYSTFKMYIPVGNDWVFTSRLVPEEIFPCAASLPSTV